MVSAPTLTQQPQKQAKSNHQNHLFKHVARLRPALPITSSSVPTIIQVPSKLLEKAPWSDSAPPQLATPKITAKGATVNPTSLRGVVFIRVLSWCRDSVSWGSVPSPHHQK